MAYIILLGTPLDLLQGVFFLETFLNKNKNKFVFVKIRFIFAAVNNK